MPPSFEELYDRLQGRNTDAKKAILSRLHQAGKELQEIGNYDYVVVNKEVDQAAKEILNYINDVKEDKFK